MRHYTPGDARWRRKVQTRRSVSPSRCPSPRCWTPDAYGRLPSDLGGRRCGRMRGEEEEEGRRDLNLYQADFHFLSCWCNKQRQKNCHPRTWMVTRNECDILQIWFYKQCCPLQSFLTFSHQQFFIFSSFHSWFMFCLSWNNSQTSHRIYGNVCIPLLKIHHWKMQY